MSRFNWAMIDVDPETGCWIWAGATNNAGYGPHRKAWEELIGPIPNGHDLDHLCRRIRCLRPSHMEPVTRAENNRRILRRKVQPISAEQWAVAQKMAMEGATDAQIAQVLDRKPGNVYTMRKRGRLKTNVR